MSAFLDALHSGRVLLMDGAMGTELQKAGLRDDEIGTAWNLLHPERVRAVHQAYRDAGAEVFLTNTFLIGADAYRTALRSAGTPYRLHESWRVALDLLPADVPFRLADFGPVFGSGKGREFDKLGRIWAPSNPARFRNCLELDPGREPHAVLLETCSTPRVRFAVRYLLDSSVIPVLLSLTYTRDPADGLVTYGGQTPEWFASRAAEYGIVALGVNCGRDVGMDETIEIVRRYRAVTDLPLFARPNAGTPTRDGDRWVYPLTPEAMAARLPELLEAGARMVGGCCGTTPAHIAACKPVIDAWNARLTSPERQRGGS
jgi:methionine synthase I (cobalamin-dependent)